MDSLIERMVTDCPPVALDDMLAAREARAERQRALLTAHGKPLLSFTLNIPGAYKSYPLARRAFQEGMAAMRAHLRRGRVPMVHEETTDEPSGFAWFAVVDGDARAVKRLALAVEQGHGLGRLFDLDVIGQDGLGLRGEDAGRPVRECVVCGKPVWECARSRAHPAEELSLRTGTLIARYFDDRYADAVAALATKALLYEVNTTPKPGLVDQNNTGSHTDMDLFAFVDSSVVLTPYFRTMVGQGQRFPGDADRLLPWLRYAGQVAEDTMFAATAGVNTHKGLIFTMGLLCAAAGWMDARRLDLTPDALLAVCGRIAAGIQDELGRAEAATHGERVFSQYGLTGARGEAAAGYPTVRDFGYPAFQQALATGYSVNNAGVYALLHLLARVEDTNVAARKNAATLGQVQAGVAAFLDRSDTPPEAAVVAYATELDRQFITERISPGGSADLVAAVYFLHFMATEAVPPGAGLFAAF